MSVIWKTHLAKKEAISYAVTERYKDKTAQEIVAFQLFEDNSVCPLTYFRKR